MRPAREQATSNGQAYFVPSATSERKPFFRHERWAMRFINVLYSYRPERYHLHGFTVLPDHIHCLITPQTSLELSVQCMKGGFSFQARRELAWVGEIWASGFSDHRIRDDRDFAVHSSYIARNAVKAGLVEHEQDYPYCSANGQFELSTFPPGLKPSLLGQAGGAAKAAPFQGNT